VFDLEKNGLKYDAAKKAAEIKAVGEGRAVSGQNHPDRVRRITAPAGFLREHFFQ